MVGGGGKGGGRGGEEEEEGERTVGNPDYEQVRGVLLRSPSPGCESNVKFN